MSRAYPYQPLLLRLLHGVTAILVLGALLSGYWVYNQFDGRWGRLALPRVDAIIDWHGTIGLTFFLWIPLFILYSLTAGRKRLVTSRTELAQLRQLPKPRGQVALHRLTNTGMLLACLLAVISGRLMDETWLPTGELFHAAYTAHLLAWLGVAGCLALHVLTGIRVGGVPLLLSMLSWKSYPHDRPRHWVSAGKHWLQQRGWLR